jgi:2',3'-cyclic-nucleotide 2'-phosphodiesterase (5'-nucleotidase family)
MNRIGYEVWTPGNHDFDISSANLYKLTSIAKFPTVSANVLDTADRFPVNNKEYVVIEKNGLKIGIIGLMSSGFYNLVNKNSSTGIKILPPIETVQRLADLLDSQTDVLIALTHEGVDEDSVLAMNVHGVDIIVGGHSHTRLKQPKKINNVLIVQTGSNCENLGVLDVTIEKHHVIAYEGKLLPLWYDSDRPTTTLSKFIDSIKTNIDLEYSTVIGMLKTDWMRGNNGESGIGDFIADAQREAVQADVSFMNSSGIRKDMVAGPITKKDIFEILPFRNLLTTFRVTGSQLRPMIETIIKDHGNVQTSGIRCEWQKKENGEIVLLKIFVNGQPLEDSKTYTGVASDYMMGEAEKYFGMKLGKATVLDQTVFSAIENKVRAMKGISSGIEDRIHEVK